MTTQPASSTPIPAFGVAAHAYPWDVIGDPTFPTRMRRLGIGDVTLAASYHGTRAATPHHPAHRMVDAPHTALYRPVRPEAWLGGLTPVPATWVDSADPFAESAAALSDAGIRVHAWVVLAHSSRLGTLHPEIAVRNCFDDRYPYALCPSHPQVRDYCTTVAVESIRGVPVDGVSVEGCGQLGAAHAGAHEKTEGAYSPVAQRVLSICCCQGCERLWVASGLEPDPVRRSLRDAVATAQRESDAALTVEELLGDELAGALLAGRLSSQDALRDQVLSALRAAAPEARITLHGQPDRWATGPSPAVTARAAAEVDAVLVPSWAPGPGTVDAITAMRELAPSTTAVGAYVTVLPPARLDGIEEHVDSLLAAGADELHLYHLGLANSPQLSQLGHIARRGRPL